MAQPVHSDTPVATSTASPAHVPSDPNQGKTSSYLTINLLVDIPVVKAVLEKSESTWQTVKERSTIAKWTLNAVEFTARTASRTARIFAKLFKVPIDAADRAISGRIIEAEKRWPILKESPNKVVEATVAALRGGLCSVAADGRRTVSALSGLAQELAGCVQRALDNFEDLVDEIAAGGSRIVEGQSSGTSEASVPAQPCRGLVARALQSGLYLWVGGAARTMACLPFVGRLVSALQGRAGPQQAGAGNHQSSRASPTAEESASEQSHAADEEYSDCVN